MQCRIAAIGGDGVGPEVVAATITVIRAVARRFGHDIQIREGLAGRSAYRQVGRSFPPETREICEWADAILRGAGGGPPEDAPPPDQGDFNLRRDYGCACNFRPIKLLPPLMNVGPIKPEVKSKGVDFVIVRDIGSAGAYGPGGTERGPDGRVGRSEFCFLERQVEGTVRPAFELARGRRRRIHLVGYWGTIGCGGIWREVFDEVAQEYPDVERYYMRPDNCNQMVVRDPSQFDVVLFDDIFRGGMVVDVAALLAGSLGMSPSAELRPHVDQDGRVIPSLRRVFGLYQPSHGTVDKRAGKDEVNPIATVLSVVEMFRYTFDLHTEANAIEEAILRVLENHRTYDIMEPGKTLVSCSGMGKLIADELAHAREASRV